jgi:hypothetical protein
MPTQDQDMQAVIVNNFCLHILRDADFVYEEVVKALNSVVMESQEWATLILVRCKFYNNNL